MTPEQAEALDAARTLAAAGIPIFVAPAAPGSRLGFRLPVGWETTTADPAVVDAWTPGDALCLVTGHGLDLLDVDLHKGGDPTGIEGGAPTSYAAALTPSGGVHSFIRSIGVASRDNVLTGVDVKAGDPDGKGRGFAFIAPTVKTSKVTGQPAAYRWAQTPDITRLRAALSGEVTDTSGARLAAMINALRAPQADVVAYDGPTFEQMDPDLQAQVTRWVSGAVEGLQRELHGSGAWPPGTTDERGRGWEKLQADAALRLGQLARAPWNGLTLAEAEEAFLAAAPTDGTWSAEDVATKWRLQCERLEPAPWPDLRTAGEREEESWAALGLSPTPAAGSTSATDGESERPDSAAVNSTRYFGVGGLQAATLAGDVMALGPVRTGIDGIHWSYSGGVWSPDKHVVKYRIARLMGERHRKNYIGAAEDLIGAYVETIECDPIEGVVNFRNGLLDWRTGELAPHSPDVPTTVQLGVEYHPDAECPSFEKFLLEVLPADMIETVWELIGYLMYSGNPLHKAVMLTGTGRNGKGTFLRVLLDVLGRRNVTSVSLHDLINTRFTTASLFGKLANIAGDIDATYLENTATFKQITGGDTISAEHKGRDRFDFTPWATPVFSANKIPASADTSIGYLARWLVVPFPHSFVGREDRGLDHRLRRDDELAGIAARGIAALPRLLERGEFPSTESGQAATEEFVRRVDQVRTWISDCCSIADEHPWIARTALYEAYRRWALRDGHKPVRATEFYDRVETAGAVPAKVRGDRGYHRIRVIDDAWGTGFTMPQGAAGAHVSDHAAKGAQSPGKPTVSVNEPSTTYPAASSPAPSGTAAMPAVVPSEGAEGAEPLHPPYARVTQEGGRADAAPPAPSADPLTCGDVDPPLPGLDAAIENAPASKPAPKPKTEAQLRASERAAEKRAAARAEKVAQAGGPHVDLPALVTRDGAVRTISTGDAAALLATITDAGQALTVDVEHTGFPVGHRHYALRTVQLGCEHFAIVLDPHVSEQHAAARTALAAAGTLHAHSATADLVPLAVAGLLEHDEAWGRMHDTVIDAKLDDPASTGSDPGLKELSAAVLGHSATAPSADEARAALFKAGGWLTQTKADTPLERSGWAQVSPTAETMIRYAASDVLDTAALAARLPAPPPAVLERERTAQRMTARVAYRGLRIDGEHVDALHEQQSAALADAGERLRAFGVENPGSDAQVAAAIERQGLTLPRTPRGKPSVAKAGLEAHAKAEGPLGDLIRARLDYQEAENRLGLFLENYRQLVRHGDGRARPTVYTLGADTGRMSCVRPNLQQVPREGGFRACLTADPGHLLISADFASVELRVAAALSGDTNLRAILADPERDVHREVAQIAFGPTAGKAERYMAKRGVFGRIYGGGRGAIARGVGVSEAVAQQIIDALDQMLPQLSEWSRLVRDATESGRTQFHTYAGRVVHLDPRNPHKAPNYCITPDTLILRSDLRHVPASAIRPGDRLVAFDEYPGDSGSGNKYHRMRTAIAERVSTVTKPSVTVRTADGKASTCSADHLWLARPLKASHRGPRIRWMRADQLQPGDALLSLGTWRENGSRTAGYLAGLYDGEGSMASRGEGHGHTALTFSQLPGLVMDAFTAGMAELDLGGTYAVRPPNSTSPTDAVRVNGIRNMMRVLGTLQPDRFQPRFEQMYEGAAITAGLTERVAVTSVEDAGDLELVSIQTSTRTLVANGYLSHNCIQGTARELLIDALVRWADTPWGEATLLPVHDELVVMVPEDEAQAATTALTEVMTNELGGIAIAAEASEPTFAWADSV